MILHSDQIEQLTPERLDLLAQLDEAGLFIEPSETFEMFYERLKRLRHSFANINDQLDSETGFAPFDDLKFSRNDLISDEVMDEAETEIRKKYARAQSAL